MPIALILILEAESSQFHNNLKIWVLFNIVMWGYIRGWN